MRNKQLPERINYGDIEQSGGETVTIYESLFNQSERVNYGDQSESPPPEIITIYESLFNQSERVNYGDSEIITPSQDLIIYANPMQPERINYGDGGGAIASDPTGEILRVGGLIKPRARIAINQTATLNTATFLLEFKAQSVNTSQDLLNNTNGGTEKPRMTFASSYLFFYYFGGATLFTLRSSQLLVNNTDYKAMIRINGLNSGNLYLNSVLGTVLSNNAASIPSFNQEYMIGGWPHDSTPWDFLGTISSVRIFDRALTDTEAASLGFM